MIRRARLGGTPASAKVSRASRWCSASTSIDGEHAVGAHAAQQPDTGDAGAGADLHDGPGVEDCREQAQRRTSTGTDGDAADLLSAASRASEHVVLDDEALGVGPGLVQAARHLGRIRGTQGAPLRLVQGRSRATMECTRGPRS